jgi:hypothetical protein
VLPELREASTCLPPLCGRSALSALLPHISGAPSMQSYDVNTEQDNTVFDLIDQHFVFE